MKISAWPNALSAELPSTSETLAREVIDNVGPGGHFLQETHTLKHFKDELWVPGLMTRDPREIWQQSGSKDLATVIQEKLQEILETHKTPDIRRQNPVGYPKNQRKRRSATGKK